MSAIDLRVYSNIVGVIMPRNDIRQLVASVRDILEDEVKAVEASDGEEESEAGSTKEATDDFPKNENANTFPYSTVTRDWLPQPRRYSEANL